MATKVELLRTLARTQEAARALGLIGAQDSLELGEPMVSGNDVSSWCVFHVTEQGRKRGGLRFLFESGEAIGSTKREAQISLWTTNAALVNTLAAISKEKMGY